VSAREMLLDLYFDWNRGITGISAKIMRFDHCYSRSGSPGVSVSEVPLAGLVRFLMGSGEELRAALLNAIGKDAVKQHFGLVELAEPEVASPHLGRCRPGLDHLLGLGGVCSHCNLPQEDWS